MELLTVPNYPDITCSYQKTQEWLHTDLTDVFCDGGYLGESKLKSTMGEVTGHKDNIGSVSTGVRGDGGSTCGRGQVQRESGSPLRHRIIYGL